MMGYVTPASEWKVFSGTDDSEERSIRIVPSERMSTWTTLAPFAIGRE